MKAMRGDGHGGRGHRRDVPDHVPLASRASTSRSRSPARCSTTRRATRTARSASPRTCARSCARTSSRRSARSRSASRTRSTTRSAVIVNQLELLERDVIALAAEDDISVECERLDAMRREVGRISGVLSRLGEAAESETYETIDYVGPSRRMIDLREKRTAAEEPRLAGDPRARRRRRPRHRARACRRSSRRPAARSRPRTTAPRGCAASSRRRSTSCSPTS